jgi:N-acetylglucosaminyl-diphospho-decaprenol L-rhamnosyltransferase
MPDAPSPDLSIIIVSWNVRELLRACLASLTKDERPKTKDRFSSSFVLRPSSVEIIVIDNASSDGSAEMVAAEFPPVRLIANAENRGFTGGNNQGIAAAQGLYVFFLNPDTVVMDDALPTMVSYMEEHRDVGVVGPELHYGDGSLQSSRRRFPTFGSALFESTPLAWHWPANPWARRYRMEDRQASAEEEVDWLVGAALLTRRTVGAALLTRRTVLDQVGGFDEGYFMYSEELDWCR